MAKKRKATKQGSVRRLPQALPPPDDPLQRFEELNLDRQIVTTEEASGASRTTVAMAAPVRGRRAIRPVRGSTGAANGEVQQTAQFRLDALQQARRMPAREVGDPVLLAATRGEPGMTATVAPVVGVSNWIQLGPTAIPNGQTYSSARVLVTGRITAIVLHPTDRQIIYVGTAQGGVWKTTDGGRHWIPTSDNEVSLAIGALLMDPNDPQVLYAGTGEGNFSQDSYYGNGILRTMTAGAAWTTLATDTFLGARFSRLAAVRGTPTRLFAATNAGLYRSINAGANWTPMTNGLPTSAAATDVVIDPATPSTVYAALWGQGIYRSTNADAGNPTWTKLTHGLPSANSPAPGGFTRVALGLSPTSPRTLYALFANNDKNSLPPGPPYRYAIDKFYISDDGGDSWTPIDLPGGPGVGIGGQGFYNLGITVDPTTPDIVYLSATSLWKATRATGTGQWKVVDIGRSIHPDNHALAVDAGDQRLLYAGTDGGIYHSTNGGDTWSDTINSGLCITQFEFIAQHPTSDAVVFGGTQDNGTEQFRNSPVFYHADDGDGGSTAIDPNQPLNVLSTYYGPTPKRSTEGGKFGTWKDIAQGLAGRSLFYPPMALDQTNPNNVAFGTDRINLDAAQGTGQWPVKVLLPGIGQANVSAIHYVNSDLIYTATNAGHVYRLTRSGQNWTATVIHAAPLPPSWIWEIRARPDNPAVVIVVLSGFNIAHVWRGTVPTTGPVVWADISGTGAGTTLPDIPANALAIDPRAPDTYYVGTDIGVYRTVNAGKQWTQFSQGLPNCAVFDLKLHDPTRVLRAATHGRGLWERRLDVPSMPEVDLFVRDHLMDTGRSSPSPSDLTAAFEDPLHHIPLGTTLSWWMCADIKVDALEGSPPAYQMNVTEVDYVAFENRLIHRNAQRGRVNRVYVQVHNRGIEAGTAVTVKLFAANASAGLPPLPSDFWTSFPGNAADTTNWTPIGPAKTLPTLSLVEPVILEWDWATPADAADHSCLLVVVDSPSDAIPEASKVFDVAQLVRTEKRVGLKNLHLVDAAPGTSYWTPFQLFGNQDARHTLKLTTSTAGKWGVGLLFRKPAPKGLELQGMTQKKLSGANLKALRERLEGDFEQFDASQFYLVTDPKKGGVLANLKLPLKGLQVMLLLVPPSRVSAEGMLTIVQEQNEVPVGGSTFVLRTVKKT